MKAFQIRNDLERNCLSGFALPLGLDARDLIAPTQGYTVAFRPAEDDEPDLYVFNVVVSHERLAATINAVHQLLPDQVYASIEIGSRDAYRTFDLYASADAVPRDQFISTWETYERFLLEDCSIVVSVGSEEPFVDIALDQWKTLTIQVMPSMREKVVELLQRVQVEEVPQTWIDSGDDARLAYSRVRPVLEVSQEDLPDVDELLFQLRYVWDLELDIDPSANLDEAGRALGYTLWSAVVVLSKPGDDQWGAFGDVWLTARSLNQVHELIEQELGRTGEWEFSDFFVVDRVAFDERPDMLNDLQPRETTPKVHALAVDAW